MTKTAPKDCLVGITKDHVSNLIDNSQSHWSGNAPLTIITPRRVHSIIKALRLSRHQPNRFTLASCVFYFRHSDIIKRRLANEEKE